MSQSISFVRIHSTINCTLNCGLQRSFSQPRSKSCCRGHLPEKKRRKEISVNSTEHEKIFVLSEILLQKLNFSEYAFSKAFMD
mmetsp:Transcript_2266/g.4867  ORF Transcript_2266/g.4867 Transcript_2266/m.4867 type:complete len:83 (+) Transcript_2266:1204-1452(+)